MDSEVWPMEEGEGEKKKTEWTGSVSTPLQEIPPTILISERLGIEKAHQKSPRLCRRPPGAHCSTRTWWGVRLSGHLLTNVQTVEIPAPCCAGNNDNQWFPEDWFPQPGMMSWSCVFVQQLHTGYVSTVQHVCMALHIISLNSIPMFNIGKRYWTGRVTFPQSTW